jgi:predicted RNA-binding Zn-ribbon protein involved in translation (DUF1610 family)
MTQAPPPLPELPDSAGTTQTIGQTTDDGRGRIFPCDQCGADLTFHIGQQSLKCPFCGYVKELEFAPDSEVAEQDFEAMLARLAELKKGSVAEQPETSEVRCESCGGTVQFLGTLTSTECPYCASPIQREHVHDSPERVPVNGVLPFLIDRDVAAHNLREWVASRWFAPTEFRKRGVEGKFNGIYLPYWTFDSVTHSRYTGRRGEHYYVTVGTGKDERRERRTRWYPAVGSFSRFFDDVLAFAARGLPRWMMLALEPWPLAKCIPFNQQALAGFLARTYDVELAQGFADAKTRMEEAIRTEVRQRIGGDEQEITSLDVQYGALTYKHLLLPVWLLVYRYRDKPFQVAINAATGEVQGERPYSWVKIAFAVLLAAALIALFAYFQNSH